MKKAIGIRIVNTTRAKVLIEDAVFIKSIISKSIGLIGQQRPKPLIFTTRFGIHTFFLKFPIDVLILDKNMKVVKVKRSLKPNRFLFWNPMHDFVVELPERASNNTNKGDRITLR
jgi:uncharacterized membrane protein (UPF0127 family)